MSTAVVILIGIIGGLAGAMQSQFLGVMENKVGTLASTFVTYGFGGLAIGAVMVAFGGGKWSQLRDLPWWMFAAGLFGLVVVATLGITISNLGLGAGMTLFTSATLVLAALIDNYGWFSDQARVLDGRRIAGIALVIVGTWLVVGTSQTAASG